MLILFISESCQTGWGNIKCFSKKWYACLSFLGAIRIYISFCLFRHWQYLFFCVLTYFDSLHFILLLIVDRSQDKGFNTEGALTHIFVRTESIQIPDDSLQICHELKCLHNNYIMQKSSRYVDIHVGLERLIENSIFSVYDKWTLQ